MTCIVHDFKLVGNHYNDAGERDGESFSDGEWRTEKVCQKCRYVLDISSYKALIKEQ